MKKKLKNWKSIGEILTSKKYHPGQHLKKKKNKQTITRS
jgi:hypothetical protein